MDAHRLLSSGGASEEGLVHEVSVEAAGVHVRDGVGDLGVGQSGGRCERPQKPFC